MDLEYAKYRAACSLSQCMPRQASYSLAKIIAAQMSRRDDRGREAVISNLRHIHAFHGLHLDQTTLERMALQTFYNFAKHLVDFFRFTRISLDTIKSLIAVEHPEYIDQAVALNRGILLLTAHLGNWEIGGAVISAMGHTMNAVVLPQRNERANRLFQSYREMRGFKVIQLGSAAHEIFRAIERREAVALLADRDYGPRATIMDFFGAPARLPSGPAKLCRRTRAPIVPGFLIRTEQDTFVLRLYPPIIPDDKSTVTDIQSRICRILEQEISRHPSQWFIFDNFWRTDSLANGYGHGTPDMPARS